MIVEKNNKTFRIANNNLQFWQKYEDNEWESDTFKIFDHFINPRHSFIDIGAWIGPTILYGVQKAKHVYAIEPDPVAFNFLKTNVNRNPDLKKKISLFNHCIGNINGEAKLGVIKPGDSLSSLICGAGTPFYIVKSFTFEQFIIDNKITDCDFIKIDIEGGEALVLPSMKSYLINHKPVVHLSLHPHLFANLNKDVENILNVIRIYKNIYTSKGNPISIKTLREYLLLMKRSCDVVLTDTKWLRK